MAFLGYKRTPIPFISGERSMSRILRRTKRKVCQKELPFSWRQDGHGCLFVKWRVGSRCCHCHVRSKGVNHKIIEVIGFYHVVLFFIQVLFSHVIIHPGSFTWILDTQNDGFYGVILSVSVRNIPLVCI